MVYNSYVLHVDKKIKNKTANFSLQESLLVDNKAQESGSRNSFLDTGVKGCHRLALQSVTHKPCLRSRTLFISTHTILSSNCSSFSATSTLQWNNNRSGATRVRSICAVYVGLLCVITDGYWVMGAHCSFS